MLLPEFPKKIEEYILLQIRRYFLPFLSALLLFFSFAPFDLFFLTWFAFIPLFFFLFNTKDYKTTLKGGFIFGFFYFFGNTYWIYHSLYNFGSVPLILSIAIVALLACYLALYPTVFSLIYKNLIRSNLPTAFYAPFIWVSLEVIRTYLFTGFPWAVVGYSQYKFLTIIQISDITGVYGVSYLILLFNCFIFDFILFKSLKKQHPLVSHIPIVISSFLVILIFILSITYGLKKLGESINEKSFTVALIQGSIPQQQKWDFKKAEDIISIYKNLTIEARKYSPQIVVWPETAVPFIFEKNKYFTNDLLNFVKNEKIYLLFGTIMERQKDKFTNSAVLINPDGEIVYFYDKIHLVPFGEYVPLRKILFFIDKLTVGIGDYEKGDSFSVGITPFGRFATLICYEIIFPEQVKKFCQKGINFIVNITNDAWFGNTSGPYQHFAISVFRAVENRKPLIRTANSGISGLIDDRGRVLYKTKLFERTYIVFEIKTNNKITFFAKYGEFFTYVCFVFSLIFTIGNIKIGGKKWLHLKI